MVWRKMVCDKDGVSKMVCDKVVRERWSVTVCERWCVCVKDVVSKMVCERWCLTKWCVKDGVRGSPELIQEALRTAPATRQPAAATTRAPVMQEALCTAPATPQPAATTRASAPPGGSVYCYCACHSGSQPRPSGDHARSSSARRLCVLRLPSGSQPRHTCAAAPPGGSVYCACHATASRGPAATTSGVMSCAVMSAVI